MRMIMSNNKKRIININDLKIKEKEEKKKFEELKNKKKRTKNLPQHFRHRNNTENAWSIRTIAVCSWLEWSVFYFANAWSSNHFCRCHTNDRIGWCYCLVEAFLSSSCSMVFWMGSVGKYAKPKKKLVTTILWMWKIVFASGLTNAAAPNYKRKIMKF